MVECFLAKEDVAGSTPVSRSNNLRLYRSPMERQKLCRGYPGDLAPGAETYGG